MAGSGKLERKVLRDSKIRRRGKYTNFSILQILEPVYQMLMDWTDDESTGTQIFKFLKLGQREDSETSIENFCT